jgi:hypothetical protein
METARVAEIIATTLAFAKTFCGPDSTNELSFAFRWRGLAGRHLSSWASPDRHFFTAQTAQQDDLLTHVSMPIATVPEAIGLHVEAIVKPLFRLFGGTAFQSGVLQSIVTDRLNSRL